MPTKGRLSVKMRDYGGEEGTFGVRATILDAANFDAQATLRNAFIDAVEDISLGLLGGYNYGNHVLTTLSNPAAEEAQRELKWLVQYHDNSTLQSYWFEVPCADPAQLDPNDRAHANIGDAGVVDAFVAAAEAYILSPTGGSITIDEITLEGRNV